mgnify:CR=1 FL=1
MISRISKLTKEVFSSERWALIGELTKVQKKISELDREYIEENRKYLNGQKLKVKESENSEPITVFVREAYLTAGLDIGYEFYKANEHGTNSWFQLGRYNYEIVE